MKFLLYVFMQNCIRSSYHNPWYQPLPSETARKMIELSAELRVQHLGVRVMGLGFRVMGFGQNVHEASEATTGVHGGAGGWGGWGGGGASSGPSTRFFGSLKHWVLVFRVLGFRV